MKEVIEQSSVEIDTIIAAHRRLEVGSDIQVVPATIIQAVAYQFVLDDKSFKATDTQSLISHYGTGVTGCD